IAGWRWMERPPALQEFARMLSRRARRAARKSFDVATSATICCRVVPFRAVSRSAHVPSKVIAGTLVVSGIRPRMPVPSSATRKVKGETRNKAAGPPHVLAILLPEIVAHHLLLASEAAHIHDGERRDPRPSGQPVLQQQSLAEPKEPDRGIHGMADRTVDEIGRAH